MLLKLVTRIEPSESSETQIGSGGSSTLPTNEPTEAEKSAAQINCRDFALEKLSVAEKLLEQAAYDLADCGCYDHIADLIKMSAQLTHIRSKETE